MLDVTKHINYHKLRDAAARLDPEEGVRQGLEDVKNGRVRPAREFLTEFEAKHGIRKQRSGRRASPTGR